MSNAAHDATSARPETTTPTPLDDESTQPLPAPEKHGGRFAGAVGAVAAAAAAAVRKVTRPDHDDPPHRRPPADEEVATAAAPEEPARAAGSAEAPARPAEAPVRAAGSAAIPRDVDARGQEPVTRAAPSQVDTATGHPAPDASADWPAAAAPTSRQATDEPGTPADWPSSSAPSEASATASTGAGPTVEADPFFESALLDEETSTRLPRPAATTPPLSEAASAQGAAAAPTAGAGLAAAGAPETTGATAAGATPETTSATAPGAAPATTSGTAAGDTPATTSTTAAGDTPTSAAGGAASAGGASRGTESGGAGHPKPSPAAAALAAAAAAAAGQDRGPWADLAGASEPDDSTADVITAYPSARPGPAGAIYGVGITVLVTDLARSAAFYRDTLGFFEIDGGEGSAVLASGDTRLVLRTVTGLSADAGRLIYLNLEVGDVEAVYQELVAKGVEFVHPPRPVNRGDRLELWSATFRDPDDHNIAITQWRAIR
ncbi:VOC family protein [Actinoplanes sp. LDG1-06]|uniref:VOC family protein n=1 Tax=Paractinoplanes ovalisporus TaxID=2810368 RepID=A0ABS2AP80_9ACTN|nr:VOC family protein [Actinoplanes ovalisporus]